MGICNDLCNDKYLNQYQKQIKSQGPYMYYKGYKLCINCHKWMNWDGNVCPCCHTRLRYKPHNNKSKRLKINKSKRLEY